MHFLVSTLFLLETDDSFGLQSRFAVFVVCMYTVLLTLAANKSVRHFK